ncbi:hypothetical protein JTE90_009546 [Oedothorax gibbosus]|uniref:Uncharacterized protein n=1 Tax=Oedothorax gibbosus TaxID=931172 RepID=A0AAV6UT98_9ARAC|nr:hypothetical protein JTE90_009546 [Oedothorax gibbosus]
MAAKIFQSCNLPMFSIALLCFFIRCSLSAPVEPVYANFVRDMNASKCSSPDQIKLPLNASTSEGNDNSLSAHLQLCQNLDAVQRRKEAHYLCQEIFANLKVILCPPISAQVLAANLTLSKDVCKDIGSLKDSVPEDQVMLKRLTDIINCELMCDLEYETTCQILLWSHQLQESKKIESPQKEAKENSLQAGLEAVAGTNVADDQKDVNQASQKKVTSELQTVGTGITKKHSSNDLLSTVQKSLTVKEDQQNELLEQQGNPGSTLQNPPQIQPKEQSSINPPLNENNLTGNNSLNEVSKVKEIKNNELPGQDGEPPNGELQEQEPLDQQEDPHDQQEDFHHQQEVSRKEPDTEENQPQAPDNTLPNIKVTNESPNHPKEGAPEQNESNAQDNLPKIAVDEEPIDPHDAEEPGEEILEENDQKIPSDTDKQKTGIDKPRQGNEAGESKTTDAKTTIEKAVTTKHQSSEGTTKKLIAPTNKETTLKEQTLPAVKPQSTLGQKTSGLPLLVKPQETSSLQPSTPKDPSVSTAALEEMEGDKAGHEKPEDREPDPYSGIYEPKYKETFPIKPKEEEVPKIDAMRPREPSYNDFSPRQTYNRQPEVMPIFPDQEDGHFFFYFLSIVLILMGGYLLFHNKQKIIALIVEGRHERRRRSHGVGYKKLETK